MNKSGLADQVIAHPHGGGALKGIGDSFSPDLHTGTGNLTVPLALPPGRRGLQPDLKLVYSSGQGNGAFGLGWALSIPGIARDTTKGVPRYCDDCDTFVIAGAEQLAPIGTPTTGVTSYRPRTEGAFARIEHRTAGQDDYWQVQSCNGLTSRYGHPGEHGVDTAVVSDPGNPQRVFAWNLTETSDPFGNLVQYLYEREPVRDDGPHHWDQVYLQAIQYADYGAAATRQFLVRVDFVYEPRPDPFSTYRAGIEVRTTQRCAQIEVRTLAESPQLVRVYRLVYQDQAQPAAVVANGASLLCRLEIEGVDGQARETLPPLEFGYSVFDPTQRTYAALSAVGTRCRSGRSPTPTSSWRTCSVAVSPMSCRSATRRATGATSARGSSTYQGRSGGCRPAFAWETRGCNWPMLTVMAILTCSSRHRRPPATFRSPCRQERRAGSSCGTALRRPSPGTTRNSG